MLSERIAAADPNEETESIYLRLIQLIDEHTPDDEDDEEDEEDG
jgi:hypothetical protein